LDEYDRIEPWENARSLGDRLIEDLGGLAGNYPDLLSSVSGKGLLISLKCSSRDAAEGFCRASREEGLLMNTGKVDPSTVVIRPSLLITSEEVSGIVEAVTKTLKGMRKKG
ncbi:MAG TPA: aminotransferase class III-fold pyridoxal phosphate-dependent enzyme, partial [Deltaproteobacteria bacterium]|nr:aminotransferase class III-fold pyridoxal phosphate-dependent enzyme [Deltaproteobacteria bacterium]